MRNEDKNSDFNILCIIFIIRVMDIRVSSKIIFEILQVE